ncbi:hypothetical protein MBLNU13_g09905t1 [Cladosporium sp. NU13]
MELLNASTFRQHVEALMVTYRLPGLSISICRNDTITSTGFGVASRKSQQAATADTLYDIASSSKSLTAASVALLVEDNENFPEVQWKTPLHELLPEDFAMPTPELTKRVTVEDVLSHRTGMALHDLAYLGIGAKQPDTPRTITRKMRSLPMAAPEKQKYMLYNNMMYTVASHLVEAKTGKSFSAFLRERFFEPLGMTSTYLQASSAIASGQSDRLASGHQFNEENNNWDEFDAPDAPEAQGAGSIVTSAADYIKYVQAMLHSRHPISPDSRKALIKARIMTDTEDNDHDPFCSPELYCLGWGTYYYRGSQVVIHEGLIDGFGSSHFFLPAHDFGAVILGNADGAEQITWILARELIDGTLKIPEADRPDWAALQAQKLENDDSDTKDELEELRERLKSDEGSEKPVPNLDTFVGDYVHLGYGTFNVEVRGENLFIDATDRGFPCTFTFEHVRTWQDADEKGSSMRSSMIANLVPTRGSPDEHLPAQFVLGAHGESDESVRATKMAILLEDTLPDDEMIWFDRV